MTATRQCDQVISLVKSDPKKALTIARNVADPWYRTQALAWVARFTNGAPLLIAAEAAAASQECNDAYKRSAVRAWEIAALAERDYKRDARASLSSALSSSQSVQPAASQSEALFLPFQAAHIISAADAREVHKVLQAYCPADKHWRCKRALRDATAILAGEHLVRPFFW